MNPRELLIVNCVSNVAIGILALVVALEQPRRGRYEVLRWLLGAVVCCSLGGTLAILPSVSAGATAEILLTRMAPSAAGLRVSCAAVLAWWAWHGASATERSPQGAT